MSAPNYSWWYAWKAEVRRYPALKSWYGVLPKYTFILPWSDRLTYAAVTKALEDTGKRAGGPERLKFLELALWQGYTIARAAEAIPCSLPTGQRWHHDFLLLAARYRGLPTEGKEERSMEE